MEFSVIFSRASRPLRDSTQVVTFLSVTKKMSGRTEKVTLFSAFLQAGLTDLDEIWLDGRFYGVAVNLLWRYTTGGPVLHAVLGG